MTDTTSPPCVKLRDPTPLQDYYQDRDGNRYSVARLIDDSKDLPVFDVPVAALDLTDHIWRDANMYTLAFHVKKCMDADLSFPILIAWDGCIADGRHRILKAIATGERTILARRLQWKPEPDRRASGE